MESKDLRIGNYVLYAGMWQQVYSIGETAINIAQEPLKLSFIGGIPLTSEILLKAGFEKRNHDGDESIFWYGLDHAKFDFYTADVTKDRGYLIVELEQVEIRRCNYLHELQNVYYFLTKTELTINLN